ncbi:MAG: hypothetical protein VCB06_06385, partial [Alphaproteobacteria bacterium]
KITDTLKGEIKCRCFNISQRVLDVFKQTIVDIANEADCEMERGDIRPFCVTRALAKADQIMIDGVWHFEGDEKTMHRL